MVFCVHPEAVSSQGTESNDNTQPINHISGDLGTLQRQIVLCTYIAPQGNHVWFEHNFLNGLLNLRFYKFQDDVTNYEVNIVVTRRISTLVLVVEGLLLVLRTHFIFL